MRPASIGRQSDRVHLARQVRQDTTEPLIESPHEMCLVVLLRRSNHALAGEAGDIESSRRSLRKRVSLNVELSAQPGAKWRSSDLSMV